MRDMHATGTLAQVIIWGFLFQIFTQLDFDEASALIGQQREIFTPNF
jgi:hypothetical protein